MVKYLRFVPMLILSMVVFANGVSAQNGKAHSLDECMQIALKSNSSYRNAINRVDWAGANVKGSYSMILPRISSTLQSGKNTRGQTQNAQDITEFVPLTLQDVNGQSHNILATRLDPATGGPVIDRLEFSSPTRSFWGHSLTLRYDQTLFDFGRSWSTIKQAKASFDASSQDLVSARQDVYSQVKQRYIELLKAVRLEQEFTQAVERSRQELKRTQSMFEIGSVALIDVYRQEVILGTDEINLITQQTTVRIARGNLNVAMGRDPEEVIHVVDIEAATKDPSLNLDAAYIEAERNNPQLRRFEYDMKGAEHGRRAAKGSMLPTIGIGATYSRNNEELGRVYGAIDQNYFLTVGASLSFNIFNGFSDQAEVNRQSANYSIAKENWLDQKRNLHLQVKQAFLNLEGFNKISQINQTRLRSAEEEYRLAKERYRVGAGTQLEVTEAQVSLTRARVQLVSSKYDAMIAQTQLEAAMGTIEGNNAE